MRPSESSQSYAPLEPCVSPRNDYLFIKQNKSLIIHSSRPSLSFYMVHVCDFNSIHIVAIDSHDTFAILQWRFIVAFSTTTTTTKKNLIGLLNYRSCSPSKDYVVYRPSLLDTICEIDRAQSSLKSAHAIPADGKQSQVTANLMATTDPVHESCKNEDHEIVNNETKQNQCTKTSRMLFHMPLRTRSERYDTRCFADRSFLLHSATITDLT